MGRKLKERIAALLLAGGITLGSMFGLSGCKKNQGAVENNVEGKNMEEVVEEQQGQIDALKDKVEQLEKKDEEISILQQELEKRILKEEVLSLFNNSDLYVNNSISKLQYDIEIRNADDSVSRKYKALYFYNNLNGFQVGEAYEGDVVSALLAHDGKNPKWFSLEPEDVYIPAKYPNLISQIILQFKNLCLEEGSIKIEKTDGCYKVSTEYSVFEVYYADNHISKIVETGMHYEDKVKNTLVFEDLTELEFDTAYAEVEARIDELENTTGVNP